MSEPVYSEPVGSEVDDTDGWAGSEASHERAIRDVKSGARNQRREQTIRSLAEATGRGLTWRELADLQGWHHGQASGILSVLHREGRISCLALKRGRSHIYMLTEYVDGRETREAGRTRANRGGLDIDANELADRLTAAADEGYDKGWAAGQNAGHTEGQHAGWLSGYDAAMTEVGDVAERMQAAFDEGTHDGSRSEAERIQRLTIEMRRTIDGRKRENGLPSFHRAYKNCWIEHPACALIVVEKALALSLPPAPREVLL